MSTTTPELLDMLKAGVHFGHKTSKWHPHMRPFIFTTKQDVHIIDLEQTQEKLRETAEIMKGLAAEGKTILFVGTKRQAAPIVEKYARDCEMPYVSTRWLGGTITNFKHVSSVPRKLTRLKKDRDSGELKKYTKKEQLEFDREIGRLDLLVGGMETLMKLPDAVFIVDLIKEKTALQEARQLGIPIIAMCDTNADPSQIQYPIPANDDAVKSIELVVSYLAQAVKEGKKQAPVEGAAVATPAAAPVEAAK